VSAQSVSGQSGVEYCREHGLHLMSFYRWKRRLRALESAGYAPARGGSPCGVAPRGNGAGVRFTEVMVASAAGSAAALEVVVGHGRRVQVHPGFDEDTLARVVAVLERVSC